MQDLLLDIEDAIGRGYGYTELALMRECSIEELKEAISLYSREIRRKCNRLLEKNEKKRNLNAIGGQEMKEAKTKKELKELRREEAKLRSEVIEHEVSREKILTRRREYRDELVDLKKQQIAIQQQLQSCKEQVQKIAEKLGESADELDSLNSVLNPKKERLEEVVKSIEKMEEVTIHVSKDDITVESPTEIEIPDMWNTIYRAFSKSEGISNELDDMLEELTRKELKLLAKLIALVAYMEGNSLKYTLVIEEEYFEVAYELTKEEV